MDTPYIRIPFDPVQLHNCARWHLQEARRIKANGGKFGLHNAGRHDLIVKCLEREIESNGAPGTLGATIAASKIRMLYPPPFVKKKEQHNA